MSKIEIQRVQTPHDRRTFLTFPWIIYKNDQLWVAPLLPERAKTIDPARGSFFHRGNAEFFIARNAGKPVGTICIADDKTTNIARNRQDCMIGFFECIDDYNVAESLFNFARTWAIEHGLNTLYGPFNLDYEDSYGVLVEGRDRPPVILCGHTPAYYQQFFEVYGFKPARGDNLAYEIIPDMTTPILAERMGAKLYKRYRVYRLEL